jgi:hypothetical protein
MRNASPLPGLIFIIIFVAGLALAYANMSPESYAASVTIAVLSFASPMRSRSPISGTAWWC